MKSAKIYQIQKICDQRGNLSFLEFGSPIPFEIKRVYWIYDVPGGELRGSHAFLQTQEVIIALSGSFDVVLHDGNLESNYHLNRSYEGLYVPEMQWRTLRNFSTNSLALIVTSTNFKESDYIRDFSDYLSRLKDARSK